MLSRWKGRETGVPIEVQCPSVSLDMLSRWKGMETRDPPQRQGYRSDFGYAFPVEGNGNAKLSRVLSVVFLSLDMLSRWKGMETTLNWKWLPLWGTDSFGYAFPLEGNGNLVPSQLFAFVACQLWICFPGGREWKLQDKNILQEFAAMHFGYAFPFEGNRNASPLFVSTLFSDFGYALPFEGNRNFHQSESRACMV